MGRVIRIILIVIAGFFATLFSLLAYSFIAYLYDDCEEQLGGGYVYFTESPHSISGPQINIPPEVIDCKYDKRFIVVKQRLNGQKPQRDFYRYDYNYPSLYGDYYWIIDKQEDCFYGPMNLREYLYKLDSLDVGIHLSS